MALENVSVSYRSANRPAISSVSFRVDPGEIVLLAGPSGCGKSTVMRVINGLVPNTYRAEVTGAVIIDGQDARSLNIRTISDTVGTLLQNPSSQVVGHSVLADMAFGLENRSVPPHTISERVRNTARALGIDEALLAADTDQLSGGQLQLVAFAGVLVLQPKLIIVDEPLANLDWDSATRLLQAIRVYANDGGAALVIEHRVDDVVSIAPDRVIYLEHGHVMYSGDLHGFLRTADPAAVRLPFDALVNRVESLAPQHRPKPAFCTRTPLRYRNVDIGYETTAVIHDVSLQLGGQRVAVVGPNGAGKTTLMRAAVGLANIIAGSVELDGQPVARYAAADLAARCGYLFQDPAQALFCGTVADELAFGPRNLGLDANDIARVSDDALRAVGLADLPGILSIPPRALSFGEQRRLALALALTLQPRVLILDEPTAGQDERSAAHFLDAISTLSTIDSIYFITHDVDLALWRSDRIIVLHAGRVIADRTPSELVHDKSLWCGADSSCGCAVLRETGYVRAARAEVPLLQAIPPPSELANRLSLKRGSAPS